jgi:allantoicase
LASDKVKEIIKNEPAFAKLTDLAAEKLGGKVLYATDDFFAEKENLIKAGRGIFVDEKYTSRGKWMDGWESRRKRVPGHDWCVVQLAVPGRIAGCDIDTNFFLGNHPPAASVEAVNIPDASKVRNWEDATIQWKEIIPNSPLDAGSRNFFESRTNEIFSHVRLHIYPDGGVARLKVFGEVFRTDESFMHEKETDLAAALSGGKAIQCNDMFFSSMDNLIMPGRGVNMGDGWETKRNRTPNNCDWVIIRLARPGIIEKIVVDTAHFKGNYPDQCSIDGCLAANGTIVEHNSPGWFNVLPRQKLQPDTEHVFTAEIIATGAVSHVKLNIFPDGGVSRLRIFGKINK